MNWLAKINLKTMFSHIGPFRSAMILLFGIALCLFSGYRFGNFYHAYQETTIDQQQLRLDELYLQQEQQLSRINTLEVELEVERLANQQTRSSLKEIEQGYYQAKKDLAFYQNVMAPEKSADGLIIDSFKLAASQSENHYRFQMTLVQQKLKKPYAKGHIDLVISGSENGKPKTLQLSDISTGSKKSFSFSFKYFQIIEGDFTLPENFIAETVNISAILPKGRWQKYYRIDESHTWLSLLKNDLTNAEAILD